MSEEMRANISAEAERFARMQKEKYTRITREEFERRYAEVFAQCP